MNDYGTFYQNGERKVPLYIRTVETGKVSPGAQSRRELLVYFSASGYGYVWVMRRMTMEVCMKNWQLLFKCQNGWIFNFKSIF